MFGQMNVEPSFRLQAEGSNGRSDADRAVSALLDWTGHPEIARWVQFPTAVLLFLVILGDPEGVAFFVFRRKRGTWFWIDFADQKYGSYSRADFEDPRLRHPEPVLNFPCIPGRSSCILSPGRA